MGFLTYLPCHIPGYEILRKVPSTSHGKHNKLILILKIREANRVMGLKLRQGCVKNVSFVVQRSTMASVRHYIANINLMVRLEEKTLRYSNSVWREFWA